MNREEKKAVLIALIRGEINKVEAKAIMEKGITSVIIQDGSQKTKTYLEALKKISKILFVLPSNNR